MTTATIVSGRIKRILVTELNEFAVRIQCVQRYNKFRKLLLVKKLLYKL